MSENPPPRPSEFEKVCPFCNGQSAAYDYQTCRECHGTGLVPNERGRAVLELVRRNLLRLKDLE